MAKTKARTAALHPSTQKPPREVCKPWLLLPYSWGIVREEMGANPFWLKGGIQGGWGEADPFCSEPYLKVPSSLLPSQTLL